MNSDFDPFDPEEWGDKPGCSAFETALEMRQRGALAATAVSVLDAHLVACDDCRDHAARLTRVNASLAGNAALPDLRSFREKLNRELKTNRHAVWWIAGAGLVAAVVCASLLHIHGRTMQLEFFLVSVPFAVACGGFGSYVRSLRIRSVLAEPDSVGAYRRWVQWNLKGARVMRWLMPFNGAMVALRVPDELQRYAAGDRRVLGALFLSTILVVCFAGVTISSWWRAHRLKAELAELH